MMYCQLPSKPTFTILEIVPSRLIDGLEFEDAGDGHWWRQRDTGSEGRCVWWVCSVLWKSGVSIAYCNIILRFGSTIRVNSFVTFRKCWFPSF
jgi:hypothetical protein